MKTLNAGKVAYIRATEEGLARGAKLKGFAPLTGKEMIHTLECRTTLWLELEGFARQLLHDPAEDGADSTEYGGPILYCGHGDAFVFMGRRPEPGEH